MEAVVDFKISLNNLDQWCKSIEQKFEIVNPTNGEYRDLCNAKQNINQPVYSWYNLKEAFSYDLPSWILKYLDKKYNFKPLSILDPFVGGGTSLLSFQRAGIESFGIEYNPFIAWVAKVKTTWHTIDIHELLYGINQITLDLPKDQRVEIPQLSTFKNSDYFNRTEVKRLVNIISQIENLTISDAVKDLLKLGVASIVEDISNLKKDGRALRFIENKKKTVTNVLNAKWYKDAFQLKDIRNTWSSSPPIHLYRGNSIDFSSLTPLSESSLSDLYQKKDLIIYSPPYLNNFDYSEVYKLELWLLGFVSNNDAWRSLRKGTVRSHHSLKFKETKLLEFNPTTSEVSATLNAMSKSRLLLGQTKKNMSEVITGYFDDMFSSLKEQYSLLSPGGFLVYNVANSKHSRLPIATDVILAEIAMKVGFEPLELIVLHNRNARTSKKLHLRESIVIMRK